VTDAAGVDPKLTLEPERNPAPFTVTVAPAIPAFGETEVTIGAWLMAIPTDPLNVVFDPAITFAGVGLPEAVSWLGVNSTT
jgi:hypothetical protein